MVPLKMATACKNLDFGKWTKVPKDLWEVIRYKEVYFTKIVGKSRRHDEGSRTLTYSGNSQLHYKGALYNVECSCFEDDIHVCYKCDNLDDIPDVPSMRVEEGFKNGFEDQNEDRVFDCVSLKYIEQVPTPRQLAW
jgi:hypothetical protein